MASSHPVISHCGTDGDSASTEMCARRRTEVVPIPSRQFCLTLLEPQRAHPCHREGTARTTAEMGMLDDLE